MKNLDFASIENVLQIIEDGMDKYHDSHGKVIYNEFTIGKTLELYVKLKLKKTNIELMMKNACDTITLELS